MRNIFSVKEDKKEILTFLLLWFLGVILFFLVNEFPGKVGEIIGAVLAFFWFYLALVISPLFRSWKTLACWEKLPYFVERSLAIESTKNEAKELIHGYSSKGDIEQIRNILRTYSDEYKQEAEDLERLYQQLSSAK